ncbi:MAG: 30S ribosomal protein S9 [Pirellulales bacterium]|nr:30S ribosomal protein S9 [Pirellulales bacterium]
MATATEVTEYLATGRRKSSVARVRLREGSGQIIVNKKPLTEFFTILQHQNQVQAPLNVTEKRNDFDVHIRCDGGGISGQAGACCLGIARALKKFNEELEEPLRENGYLTRDSRMKERKKPGLHGARRATQCSKR